MNYDDRVKATQYLTALTDTSFGAKLNDDDRIQSQSGRRGTGPYTIDDLFEQGAFSQKPYKNAQATTVYNIGGSNINLEVLETLYEKEMAFRKQAETMATQLSLIADGLPLHFDTSERKIASNRGGVEGVLEKLGAGTITPYC